MSMRTFLATLFLVPVVALAAPQTTNLAADGNHGPFISAHAQDVVVAVSGTYGSGTLVVQLRATGADSWITSYTATADETFVRVFTVGHGQFRVNLSGSTSPDVDIQSWDVANAERYNP